MTAIKTRLIIALMAFFAFLFAQIVRMNINIAIVAMETSNIVSQGELNSKVVLLGSYYWCSWLTELPSGLLAQKYGSRRVLVFSMLISAFGSFIFPVAYRLHPLSASFVRACQGLAMGAIWPGMACVSAKWIPRNERSKFMSSYHGAALGASITYGLGGFAIATLGWPSLFYATGCLCLLWSLIWWYTGFDSPSTHPRISEEERQYLEKAIAIVNQPKSKLATPWTKILTSKPFWAVFIASFGLIWASITLTIHLPMYFDSVHKLNIKTSGLLLSIPNICKFIFGLKFSSIIDYWIKNEKCSVTAARNFSVALTHIISGIFLIVLGFYGNKSVVLTTVLIILIITFGGATSSGTLANIVDISPNNAGAVMGIIRTLCVIPGILSPIIVQWLTIKDQNNWMLIFILTAMVLFSSGIFFIIFSSGEIQSWNKSEIIETEENECEEIVQITENDKR